MSENCSRAKSNLYLIFKREKTVFYKKNLSFSELNIIGQLILESKTAEMYLGLNYIWEWYNLEVWTVRRSFYVTMNEEIESAFERCLWCLSCKYFPF